MTNASFRYRRVPCRRAMLRLLSLWGGALSLWAAFTLAASPALAVVLDDENRLDVVLKDHTHVTPHGQAGPATGTQTNN